MADPTVVQNLPADPGWGSIAHTAGALLLILGFLMAAFWLLRRYGPAGIMRAPGPNGPEIVSRLFLGNKQHLAVVRMHGADLLLGVTEHRITLLKDFGADKDAAAPTTEAGNEDNGDSSASFADNLTREQDAL